MFANQFCINRIWCYLAKVNVPINKKRKLDQKLFIVYAIDSVDYSFLIIKSEIPDINISTIMKFRDAIFFSEFSIKMHLTLIVLNLFYCLRRMNQ